MGVSLVWHSGGPQTASEDGELRIVPLASCSLGADAGRRLRGAVSQASARSKTAWIYCWNVIEFLVDHRSGRRGLIRVSSRAENGSLVLEVRDHGSGLSARPAPERPGLGIGLANTRAPLEHLYPAQHRLELAEAAEGGARVTVRIPFRPAVSGAHANPAPGRPAH